MFISLQPYLSYDTAVDHDKRLLKLLDIIQMMFSNLYEQ